MTLLASNPPGFVRLPLSKNELSASESRPSTLTICGKRVEFETSIIHGSVRWMHTATSCPIHMFSTKNLCIKCGADTANLDEAEAWRVFKRKRNTSSNVQPMPALPK